MTTISAFLWPVQVARLANIPARTLRDWKGSGLTPASGPEGRVPKYSFRDTIRVLTVVRLRSMGVSMQAIRKAVEVLDKDWGIADPLADARLVAIDGQVRLVLSPGELWDISRGQRLLDFMIDLGELAREVKPRFEALAEAA